MQIISQNYSESVVHEFYFFHQTTLLYCPLLLTISTKILLGSYFSKDNQSPRIKTPLISKCSRLLWKKVLLDKTFFFLSFDDKIVSYKVENILYYSKDIQYDKIYYLS